MRIVHFYCAHLQLRISDPILLWLLWRWMMISEVFWNMQLCTDWNISDLIHITVNGQICLLGMAGMTLHLISLLYSSTYYKLFKYFFICH